MLNDLIISLKKIVLVFVMSVFTFFIVSCRQDNLEIMTNPYFEDHSKNDYTDLNTLKLLYDAMLIDYYNETYAMDIGNKPFSYHRIPGYYTLPRTEYLYRTDLAVNYDLIDLRDVYQYSALYRFIDSDSKYFFNFFNPSKCIENTRCQQDGSKDYLHYAIEGSEIFLTYSKEDDMGQEIFIYYYNLDEQSGLSVEFTYIEYNFEDEIEEISYVKYLNDTYEINMVYDGDYHMTHYNIQTSEVISNSFFDPNAYRYHYYDPEKDISFVFPTDGITISDNSYLTVYEQNQIKFKSNQRLSNVSLNLFFIIDWNKLKVDDPYLTPSTATLYHDDQIIDEDLVVYYNSSLGSVELLVIEHTPTSKVDEDIITLSRFGLDSGYTYEKINTMFDDGFMDIQDALNRYDLKMSYEEVIELFESTLMIELN
ncbi:MAG: hypothetical protein A2Y45_08495 [Tenericutes bacterium GWC2_34_14]|nr:MAG: hypothetical protein A2Z84_02760 [Tenericutes bacterium GWA2_35_7]OHE29934.1 MAG: hypothetical protein A2Y45_08495 [Tenericutes bacterium GWC2_34_14]OHE34913.1 MAG: hypothetical protein A2012_02105 [Tenericutes bacterium GWE2_34_108]OHE37227.1 MAG: hypothetical protein A2Y46_00905 [Tenericutes bacterium GWF1_35_14]OHE39641.1 MAG: hypothetical protein A2Y44_01955 [Tenericutes bacterium GWF2_35_184]OHE44171.1 MAG: hypothetical protein A2221_03555 [Tenericutes bacterium RIFOXYA2_FULL_36_3